MVILFLVALLLAWPTAGLSIVAYVAFAVFKSYLSAKARHHDANSRRAERALREGSEKVPSWAGDGDERHIFVEGIQKGAMRKGVPQTFLWAVLSDNDTFQSLVFLAGAMEDQGSSFIEQQIAVSEKLVDMWERAPSKVRDAALGETFEAEEEADGLELHPLLKKFQSLVEDPKTADWFGRVAYGWEMGLPADVGFAVNDAMKLAKRISMISGVQVTDLADAAETGDYQEINMKLNA